MDVDGANARALTRNEIRESARELSPDNTPGAVPRRHQRAVRAVLPNTTCSSCRRPAARRSRCCPTSTYAIDDAAWAPDGKSIIAVVEHGRAQRALSQIDVASRRARQLTDGAALHSDAGGRMAVVPEAGKIVFQLDEPTRWGDVWTMPIAGGGPPTQVTHALRRARARLRRCRGRRRSNGRAPTARRSRACCSIRSDYQPGSAIRSSCSCTAARWSPTSSAADRASR